MPSRKWDIKKKEFAQWRKPRFGTDNPTKVRSIIWEYAVHTRKSAYVVNKKFKGPSSFDEGACWSFDRFGKSVTFMPDGREIHIAGEHEDYYDPDFYIYNDVTVIYPDERIEFYNYPKEVFPPTDFHSATLVDDTIILIGNLSYIDNRQIGQTQILLLDTNNYKIEKIKPTGLQPGWIHKHKAILSKDKKSIKILGGEIATGSDASLLVENIDEWELDLNTWEWKRLTKKEWRQFELTREDKKLNNLFWVRQTLFSLEAGWQKEYKRQRKHLKKEIGFVPDVLLVKELYLPDIEHKIVEQNERNDTYIIDINGVRVRFNEEMHSISMTIEGDLEDSIVQSLIKSIIGKLKALEGCEYTFEEIGRK